MRIVVSVDVSMRGKESQPARMGTEYTCTNVRILLLRATGSKVHIHRETNREIIHEKPLILWCVEIQCSTRIFMSSIIAM